MCIEFKSNGSSLIFNPFTSVVNNIGENEKKIASLQKDLDEAKKNPNFYKNRNILTVAACVAILAATIIVTYFTCGLLSPLLHFALTSVVPSGLAAAFLVMGMVTPPALGTLYISALFSTFFRNEETDKNLLIKLQEKNQALLEKITLQFVEVGENLQECKLDLEKNQPLKADTRVLGLKNERNILERESHLTQLQTKMAQML